jgi:hypothetical protein
MIPESANVNIGIFQTNSNEEHIQRLYRRLGCEHHLVQEDSPSEAIGVSLRTQNILKSKALTALVQSLTPVGIAHWMTSFILAYPEEWERLEKVVMFMPIDVDGDLVDGKPEHLIKQIVGNPDPSLTLVRLGFYLL